KVTQEQKRIIEREKTYKENKPNWKKQQSTVNDKFSKIKANKKLNTIKTKSQTNIQKDSKTEFNLKRSNKSKKKIFAIK
ncbi:hypothetical protein DXA62_02215, partial [Coprobacillus sp. OF03-2AA]